MNTYEITQANFQKAEQALQQVTQRDADLRQQLTATRAQLDSLTYADDPATAAALLAQIAGIETILTRVGPVLADARQAWNVARTGKDSLARRVATALNNWQIVKGQLDQEERQRQDGARPGAKARVSQALADLRELNPPGWEPPAA